MMQFFKSKEVGNAEAVSQAVSKSLAMIEFAMDGTILTANGNFLAAFGYELAEVAGRHHSMFVEPAERESAAYRAFWADLNRGQFSTGEFRRLGKGGREVWIEGSYIPVLDGEGKPCKVVKFAIVVTARKQQAVEVQAQMEAIRRAQGVIEFALDGTILTANQIFLDLMGYTLAEVQGKSHSIFVEPAYRESAEYRKFWETLKRGEFQVAEYKRIGKGGREVWIQAAYNPILGLDGKPHKVIKFASDVTQQKLQAIDAAAQLDAIRRSQSVIEYKMDGTVITASQNVLTSLGYTMAEIEGKHHSLFVDPAERETPAYRDFWPKLNRGEFHLGEFRRIGKHGQNVYIQGSYNPIFDLNGKPFKVVRFATDVTKQVLVRMKSEAVGSLMESVAAGAEELNASVREISSSMVKSKHTADDAAGRVEIADQATQRLNNAAQAMSGIVGLINDITSKINLLALNATIESARAGEAGRGFSVVASEVKSLAQQARGATERIAQEIHAMKTITLEVVGGLQSIKEAIGSVLEYATSTAAAVEEQSTVASEMSSTMQRAAREAAQVAA